MTLPDSDTVTTGGGLLGAAALGWSLIRRALARDKVAISKSEGEVETTDGLRSENERLRKLNTELLNFLGEAQAKIVHIAGENAKLQIEVEELTARLDSLIRQYAAAKEH